jgi:hypothetical protein
VLATDAMRGDGLKSVKKNRRHMPAFASSASDNPAAAPSRTFVQDQYAQVRGHSLALASSLSAEDQCVQSMPDASPTKWHLAHTSWFFEAVVLGPHAPAYQPFDQRFFHLFNSYYETLGRPHR